MAGGDETTHAEQRLLARLDRAFPHQRNLDPAVLASVHAWQQTDRTYALVQKLVRGQPLSTFKSSQARVARNLTEHLHLAVQSGRAPFELRVFRGLRDVEVSLGVSHPSHLPGRRIGLPGFCATTVLRHVAASEFTAPRGVLLDLRIPPGTPALWVAGLGNDTLRHQGELLLGVDMKVDVYSHVQAVGAVAVLLGRVVLDE